MQRDLNSIESDIGKVQFDKDRLTLDAIIDDLNDLSDSREELELALYNVPV